MADSTYNDLPEPRGRWWALAGLFAAAAGLFTFLVAKTRLTPKSSTIEPSFLSHHSKRGTGNLTRNLHVASVKLRSPSSVPNAASSPQRTLAFLAFTVILAVMLIVLQNNAVSLAVPLFLGLVIGAIVLAIASAPQRVRGLIRTPGIAVRMVYHEAAERLKPIAAFLARYRLLFAAVSTLSALLWMIQSAQAFQIVREEKQPANKAITLMLYGIAAVGVALFCARPNIALPTFANVRAAAIPHRINRRLTLAGMAVLLLLAEINGKVLKLDFLLPVTIDQQFGLLVAGLVLLALGLSGFGVPRNGILIPSTVEQLPQAAVSPSIRSRIGHYGLLLLIVIIAFFARFYLLNDTMRFFIDEDLVADATHYLRINTNSGLLSPFSGIAAFPYIFPYFEAKTIDLFGPNFMGLRGASAIIGALTIPALYILARFLFDRKTALLAALFLATFPPHIQFSRIGINEMSGPLYATLAFAFLGRGLLHNRPWHYAVGGIFLGLTQYFDEGSRLLFAPVMVAWMVGLIIVWRQNVRGRHVMVAVVAAVLVTLPIYYTLIGLDRPLAGRMVNNQSGLGASYWRELFASGDFQPHINTHVMAAFLVYTSYPDQSLFYGGKTAMLLWYMIPAALLGIGFAIWRWRAPGMALILIWIVSVSFGNSLLTSSMAYPRFVLVFPALMLAAAVGVRYGVPLVVRNKRAAGLIALALTVALCAGQLLYYFNDYLPAYNMQFRGQKATPDGYDAALRSVNFPAGTTIHIISLTPVNQIEASGLLHLSRPDLYLDAVTRDKFNDDYIADMRCRVDHAFFIERTDFKTLNKLREKFYLREPQFTPYDDLLPSQRLILFYAPYIKGSEAVYGRKC